VVSDAMAVAAELLVGLDDVVAERLEAARDQAGTDPGQALRHGGALTQRMIGYLGQLLTAPGAPGTNAQP
jgi:hypothetical protein